MLEEGSLRERQANARLGLELCGKWRLDRVLGVGGMAAVYAATHRNGKCVAIKLLHPDLSMDPSTRTRFVREGYVANAIKHPGALSILDDDVAADGSVFFVMELLDGETLQARRARCGAVLAPNEVLAIVDRLLDVLVAAHNVGVVHRDLKPENVFVTVAGEVKILDFGIARLREPQGGEHTTHGSSLGTPAYMPPEQALGHWDQVDGRTDLWSVGATMFELLTGTSVHEYTTVNELLLAAMTKPARKTRSVAPNVPEPVANIVDRALAFTRDDRYPDARTMQRAVRAAREALPPIDALNAPPRPSSPPAFEGRAPADGRSGTLAATAHPRRRDSLRGGGFAIALLAFGAIGSIVYLERSRRAHPSEASLAQVSASGATALASVTSTPATASGAIDSAPTSNGVSPSSPDAALQGTASATTAAPTASASARPSAVAAPAQPRSRLAPTPPREPPPAKSPPRASAPEPTVNPLDQFR